jgi:hypothetical protein
MFVPSSPGSATTGAPRKGVSPARNIIGLVVLLALAVVAWLEYSANFGYNGAVKALDARTQDEEKGLMDVQEAETLLGKLPDGPGVEIKESDSGRTFTKKTYTWRALLRPRTLAAFYTKEATPHLHHYETEGAKYVPDPNTRPPVGAQTKKSARGTRESPTEPAPDTKKSAIEPAPDTKKPATEPAPDTKKPATEPAPDTKRPATEPAPDTKKPATEPAPDTKKSATKNE